MLLGVAVCLAILLGFAGRIHPAADSLSLLRMPLGILCIPLAVFCGRLWLRAALVVAGLAVLVTVFPPLMGGKSGGTLALYSKNMWFGNNQIDQLAADIRASDAAVVTLQELSNRNDGILDLLEADYPHQHICQFSRWSGVAVLSRAPILDSACSDRRVLALAKINHEGAPVWVGAIHMPWPHPYPHDAAYAAAQRLLEGLDAPVVFAGDFNIFPWASTATRMRRGSDVQLAGPLRPTFYLKSVPLFLDHAYAPGGGEVDYRPLLGSDHYGLLAQLRIHR